MKKGTFTVLQAPWNLQKPDASISLKLLVFCSHLVRFVLLSERAAIEFLGNLERRDTRTQT